MQHVVDVEFGGKIVSISTGKMAKQANGAVMVRSGDTMVLVTAVAQKEAKEGQDFFSTDCKLYRESLCGRQNSGQLF